MYSRRVVGGDKSTSQVGLLECRPKGWFWDEAVVQIDTNTVLVHPSVAELWIIVKIRGVLLTSRSRLVLPVVRPQLVATSKRGQEDSMTRKKTSNIPTTVEPSFPPLFCRDRGRANQIFGPTNRPK
jgi:hypothetical protein